MDYEKTNLGYFVETLNNFYYPTLESKGVIYVMLNIRSYDKKQFLNCLRLELEYS